MGDLPFFLSAVGRVVARPERSTGLRDGVEVPEAGNAACLATTIVRIADRLSSQRGE
jgi:hypothetical protein